jgi:hypothetical protein
MSKYFVKPSIANSSLPLAIVHNSTPMHIPQYGVIGSPYVFVGGHSLLPIHSLNLPSKQHVVNISNYDYVTVVIVTNSGSQILLPTQNNHKGHKSVDVNLRKVYHGTDANVMLQQIIAEYDLTHFGKHTTLSHYEKSSGINILIRVIYAPQISRYRINTNYKYHNSDNLLFERFWLSSYHSSQIISVKNNIIHKINGYTANILFAIYNSLSQLI